ncbi:ssDNA-binding protein [Sphingomonas asaccharolytica]|uniref:ssDNA-binding protein n=1 Tax=Sphingomonas asaccharolytica TaxID=40681 RepID=UPI00082F5D8C|nr:ssDNA-binding protein [Sphingomonas asaccharolytica]
MAKTPSITATFGPLILSFPCLNKPDEKYDVYTANGTEDPNSDAMKQAKAILADALKQFGLDVDAHLPLSREMVKDPNAPAGTKKPKKVPTGKLILKSKSQRPPAIVDANARPIDPKSVQIGGGTKALVQGFLKPYDMNGNEGISFTLTGVQIIELVERGGSSAKFEAWNGEGGYSYDGDAPAAELNIGDDSDGDDQAQDDGGILDI